ncbi:tRNA lysidine(34) synthetase TilS [uncultured Oscillibacter sp.]|uniref:tRNA lysidine(34) synthetase TilS n=1 Tax=uncultured Oscillibacter sp. TaxID=876091 RepID=UPI0025EFBF18|nr:tRNA lysidine(34) synthetase TilS [uncultured Oscillibacter sp.]
MNELLPARRFLSEHFPAAGAALLCAVSGGVDSMCLLDAVLRWAVERDARVLAAHFNHQLRGAAADRDEMFVREYCAARGVPFFAGRGETAALAAREGLSVEEAARRLRYAFLEETARREQAAVLTAHHADDNAETMLLNLCRGTGSAGLGIPPVRGNVYRPFLALTRRELEEYAVVRGLPHVEDETNGADDAARNLLRHRVLPVLREINPRAAENMARAAGLLAADSAALDAAARALADTAQSGPEGLRLDWAALRAAPESVQGRAVLLIMERLCGRRRDLSAVHVRAALELKPGASCALPYGMTAKNGGEALELFRLPPVPEPAELPPGGTVCFGAWRVTLDAAGPPGAFSCRVRLDGAAQVTAWRPGDRLTLPGSRGSRSLKRLFADAGIPPEERDRTPVLRIGGRAAAVPGLGSELSAGDAGVQVIFYKETDYKEHTGGEAT